jgi:hypothetical protein
MIVIITMKYTADEIEETVVKLLELKQTHTRAEINEMPEFEDFRKHNMFLYGTVLSEDQFQPELFLYMMHMKRKLEQGADPYEIDVHVGKVMAAKYVDPVISKLPARGEQPEEQKAK